MFLIRAMQSGDAELLAEAFSSWNKSPEQFGLYWRENESGERVTLLAVEPNTERAVGYGNVLWTSGYEPFAQSGIPEIVDLNVVEEFQERGIATSIIRRAEEIVRARGHVEIGIGFGVTPDYGVAQRLYVRLGYVPDGRGAWPSQWGDILHLTKRLD